MSEENNEVQIDFEKPEVQSKVHEYANKNWRSIIPEEFATHASMASIGDLNALAKSYVNSQSLIGRKGLILPKEGDAPEVVEAFYKALGKPDKETDYEFEGVEGHNLDLGAIKQKVAKAAFESNLPKSALKKVWKEIEASIVDGRQSVQNSEKQRIEKEWADLNKEWGAKAPENMKKIDALIAKVADEDTRQWIKDSGLGKETRLVKLISKITGLIGEDKLENTSVSSGALTPAEAMSRANDIRSNLNNPLHDGFWKREHPRHAEAMNEINRLYSFAFPKEKK